MTGEVVDALLLLSTVAQQSVEAQPLDMGRLVGQALNQLVDLQARTKASVQLPKAWPPALGYGPWVGEVWLNLVSNALKYGGTPPRLELGGARDGSAGAVLGSRQRAALVGGGAHARIHPFHPAAPGARGWTWPGAGHGAAHRLEAGRHGLGQPLRRGGGNEFCFTLPAAPSPTLT